MNQMTTTGGGALTVNEVREQAHLIQQVLHQVMVKDTHYGIIPGCKEPALLKAGAEKILSTFRIAVEPVIEDLSTASYIRYRITARGTHMGTGAFIGAGVGECSSAEEKYAWRRAYDDEYDAAAEDDRRIKQRGKYKNKQVRTNPLEVANTVLKMAKKRALVDLAITATAASDIFAQDIDELAPGMLDNVDPETGEITEPKRAPAAPQRKAPEKSAGGGEPLKPGQVKVLVNTASRNGKSEADIVKQFGPIEKIAASRINECLEWARAPA